jgi:hypothetical protein
MGVQTAARDRSWGGNVGGLWSSTWHPDDKLVFFQKKSFKTVRKVVSLLASGCGDLQLYSR